MSGESYRIELYAEEKTGTTSKFSNQHLISANDSNSNKLSSDNALISANEVVNRINIRKRGRDSAGFSHVEDEQGRQHIRGTATATTDGKDEAASASMSPAAKLRNQKKLGPDGDMTEYKRMLATTASFTVKSTGTKDRHSKVRTAKGLRDRRVRLSAPTAIQFFDVQDRLGYDQPSKAVDWLINKARAAIDELAPVEAVITTGELPAMATSDQQTVEQGKQSNQQSRQQSNQQTTQIAHHLQNQPQQEIAFNQAAPGRAESRAKARERARVRAARSDKNDESCSNNDTNSNSNSYELLSEFLMKPTDVVGISDFRQSEFSQFCARAAAAAATPAEPRLLSPNSLNQCHNHQINILGGAFNNYLNQHQQQQHAAAAAAIFAAAAPAAAVANLQDLHMMAAASNFSPRGPLQSSFGNNIDNHHYLNIISSAQQQSSTANTSTVSSGSTATISTSVPALSSCSSSASTVSSSSAPQPPLLFRHVAPPTSTNNMNFNLQQSTTPVHNSNHTVINSNASSFSSPSAASALYHHHLHHHNGSTNLPFSFYGPPPPSLSPTPSASAPSPSPVFLPQQSSSPVLINAIATPGPAANSALRSFLQHSNSLIDLDPPDHSPGLPRTSSST